MKREQAQSELATCKTLNSLAEASKNPGATAIASGVKIELADENQHPNKSHKTETGATLFWDRASNSIQPLALLGVTV